MGLSAVFILGLLAGSGSSQDPLASLRDNVPGEPGVDYPVHSGVQDTTFSCEGRAFGGYYADQDMDCQAYHVCVMSPEDNDVLYPISFLCPNGTIFNQEVFVCEWWFNVDCSLAATFYGKNDGLFGGAGSGGGHPIGGDECPALDQLGETDCEGAVSTCWSPGQPDGDCPNFGLCCFDGCANTCGEVVEESKPQPRTTPTTPGYNYKEPKVTLPVRPSPTSPPALYDLPREGRGLALSARDRGTDSV